MLNTTDELVLYYGHDPMCSFCWAFRPTWTEIKLALAKHTPPLKIISLLGGLAPDSDEPMPDAIRQKVSDAWHYIEKRIPGTQFNFDFWTTQQPRRSTYPACRAVYATRMLAPEREDDMTMAIQQAYYLNAQNPSNDDTLIQCAKSISLDETLFTDTYLGSQCSDGFIQEMQFARSIGISSFPSLVLARGNQRFNIPIDYNSAANVLERIKQAVELV